MNCEVKVENEVKIDDILTAIDDSQILETCAGSIDYSVGGGWS